MRTQLGKLTWTFPAVSTAGTYDVSFGYRLSFATPKRQTLNVDGTRIADVVFDGAMNTWLEKKQSVDLVKGVNTVQLELSWGWMDLDYLTVPSTLAENAVAILPQGYLLEQNYPNPFNPSTTVRFALPVRSRVSIAVYDILGRRVVDLVNGELAAGYHTEAWNATVSSGVYLCVMEAEAVDGPHQRVRSAIKLVLIR